MREGDSVAVRIMMDLNVNPKSCTNELVKMINETKGQESESKRTSNGGSYNSTPTLNQYGSDLTKKAREGKLDPVIGRRTELIELFKFYQEEARITLV